MLFAQLSSLNIYAAHSAFTFTRQGCIRNRRTSRYTGWVRLVVIVLAVVVLVVVVVVIHLESLKLESFIHPFICSFVHWFKFEKHQIRHRKQFGKPQSVEVKRAIRARKIINSLAVDVAPLLCQFYAKNWMCKLHSSSHSLFTIVAASGCSNKRASNHFALLKGNLVS